MEIYKIPATAGDYFIDIRDILYIYRGKNNKHKTGTVFMKNGDMVAINTNGQIDRILNDWLEYKSKNGG